MISICLYFQFHLPVQLRTDYDFFKIGQDHQYENLSKKQNMVATLAKECYLPLCRQLKQMIQYYQGKFRFAISVSGIALENFEMFTPEVITELKELVATGHVELIGETYYHSLACFYSEKEFVQQIKMHRQIIKRIFGVKTKTFRNTELIFSNELGPIIEKLGFHTVLTEGTRKILGWRSSAYLYQPKSTTKLNLILNNAPLTENIQYYFSNKKWSEYPLTTEKFSGWAHAYSGNGEVIGLFLDAETFGILHKKEAGIFEFLNFLPREILKRKDFKFHTPTQVIKAHQPMARLDIPHPISWGDKERDVALWRGNHMQDATAELLYKLESKIKLKKNKELISTWRLLTSSEVFYQLHTVWDSENLPQKHFTHQNQFMSAEKAFVSISHMINDLKERLI